MGVKFRMHSGLLYTTHCIFKRNNLVKWFRAPWHYVYSKNMKWFHTAHPVWSQSPKKRPWLDPKRRYLQPFISWNLLVFQVYLMSQGFWRLGLRWMSCLDQFYVAALIYFSCLAKCSRKRHPTGHCRVDNKLGMHDTDRTVKLSAQ